MQDRFKFRVWDNINNKMIYLTRHFNAVMVNGTICIVESFPTMNGFYKKRIGKEFDDAVLMQCTGLKDKNRKLIYEDDIVKTYPSGYFDQDNDIFYVKYNCGGFYLARPYKNMDGDWECNDTIGCYDEKLYEVIGNIHENKELLESWV